MVRHTLVAIVAALAVIVAALAIAATIPQAPEPTGRPFDSMPLRGPTWALPPPRTTGSTSLEEALERRRSVRAFSSEPLTDREIGQLLWAAQGITAEGGRRSAPSAGALYPLELYAVTPDGLWQYLPAGHSLAHRSDADLRSALQEAALGQGAVATAPLVVVITGVVARTEAKYGPDRALRYVQLEAGHAAQNLLLQAVALDLGAVPIGAFIDSEVARILGLPADESPLYLLPVGRVS